MILGFIQDNLETGWEHLTEGHYNLARHHFSRALEQVSELEQLSAQRSSKDDPNQPPLIDV